MADSARAEIYGRIRRASRGAPAETIWRELQAIGAAPSAPLPSDDVGLAFLVNVLKNQGSIDCAGDRSAAVKAVANYIYQHLRTHKLVAGNDPKLAAMPWRDGGVLPRFGAIEPGEQVALSYARLAIAETGSVVTWTGKGNPAANNLLPDHHIVLVELTDLVTTMEAAWERMNRDMQEQGRPRGINFIAGPSSTADVEAQMVLGAHGPRSWHVILMGDVPENLVSEARALVNQSR